MEESVPSGRFPLYRHFVPSAGPYGARMHFVPHRTSSRTGDKVGCGTLLRIGDEVANQSGRLVCMSGLWPQGSCAAAAALFYSFLVDSGQRPESRGEFRIQRDATQGSALRARKPLKRFDPNFISPAGGFLTLSRTGDEVKLRESSAETPVIRLKACWTVFGNHATIKRENHRTKRMISKT